MRYFWSATRWIWSKKKFVALTLGSALFFFALFFPFGDMTIALTTAIARASNNAVYVQMDTFDLNMLPTPAISANNVTIETAMAPTVEANWIRLRPAWLNMLLNAWTIKQAASGDAEAAAKLGTRLGLTVAIEGILGGDVGLSLRPGSDSEQGAERSKVTLALEDLNLSDFQKWMDLPMKLDGKISMDSTVQIVPGLSEQPEGEIELKVEKFSMPPFTAQIPVDETSAMPINLPAITLASVVLKGRLVGGQLIIEEGSFGRATDPLSGRIKGQMAMTLNQRGGQVFPLFGRYDLRVELNTTKALESQIGYAFFPLNNVKNPTATGSNYRFSAMDTGFNGFPKITRINTF